MPHDCLSIALYYRIPMLWKIRCDIIEESRVPESVGEFAICLICKTPKGTPIGKHQQGHGSVRDFLFSHARGPCRQHWNTVCHLFGAEPIDQSPPILKNSRNLLALPPAIAPPPPVETAMDRVMKENAELKAENAMLKTAFNDAMTENELLLKQLAIQLPAP